VRKVAKALTDKGFRADFDLRNEKIGFKIREHTLQRVPYLLVVGDREVEDRTVAVRNRRGEDLGTLSVDDLIAKLAGEVASRTH
jgi:threonyl-tRNA synthetase